MGENAQNLERPMVQWGEKGDRLTTRSCPDTVGGKIISRAVREEECEHAG